MKIETGKGTIPLVAVVAIWSISAVVSLPGLAISPILDKLDTIFPRASELEVEMLESLPSLMIIPFMLLAGRWSVKRNKIRMLVGENKLNGVPTKLDDDEITQDLLSFWNENIHAIQVFCLE